MLLFVFAQLIGSVALLVSIAVFQANRRDRMLKLSLVAASLYVVSFILLGAYTGAAMNTVSAVRSIISYRLGVTVTKRRRWLCFFLGLATLGTILTWNGPLSLLSMFGMYASSFAYWHSKPKQIRRWSLASSPFWFSYDAAVRSYPGMLVEIIVVVSNLVGQYRYDFNHKHHDRVRLARPS